MIEFVEFSVSEAYFLTNTMMLMAINIVLCMYLYFRCSFTRSFIILNVSKDSIVLNEVTIVERLLPLFQLMEL